MFFQALVYNNDFKKIKIYLTRFQLRGYIGRFYCIYTVPNDVYALLMEDISNIYYINDLEASSRTHTYS